MSTLGVIHGGANGCAACGEQFGRMADFDRHQDVDYDRTPVVVCKAPETMPGLVKDQHGVWQTPEGLANHQKLATRLAEARERGKS